MRNMFNKPAGEALLKKAMERLNLSARVMTGF
jgi:hypothetical protein